MRGRKPLPSNVVRLRGNPGKRRLNDAEPRPAHRVPSCPACLGDEARKEWQRLAKELGELGLLTRLDRGLLAAYCQAHALWVEARRAARSRRVLPAAGPCRVADRHAVDRQRGVLREVVE